MLILSNVLALALVVADEPKTPTAPAASLPRMSPPRHSQAEQPMEIWHLSLPEAIRIGLDNSEVVRVITFGGPGAPPGGFEPPPPKVEAVGSVPQPADGPGLVIAQINRDASVWNFQAAIMAHVRSVEQQYWALASMQVSVWARETAVKLAEEILRRERVELKAGRATEADVAEAEQQLENFKLNLISATSDLITTERQLRNILGLPANDNRRIVPDTAPTETEVNPAWEACLAVMQTSQPDILQQRQLVGSAAMKAIMEDGNPTIPAEQRKASQDQLERQKAFLQQIVHQSTHSVARFFLEIDANYKQFRTAQKLRSAAQQRLEAQRAFYEEGRITIDRLLDAVSQYSNAIAQEAQYKSTYNTSLAALEEAKGTLLASKGITIATPSPRKPYVQAKAKDDRVAPVAHEAFTAPAPAAAKAQPAPATYKFRVKIGGVSLFEVEAEVSPASESKPTEPGC